MPALLVALLVALLAQDPLALSAAAIGVQSGEPQLDPGALNSSTEAAGENATAGENTFFTTYLPGSLQHLLTVKVAVIVACAFSFLLVVCLVIRICKYRSGKKIRKTRKYDIITTPAERVEMAPLNEDNEDDEDSTVFDVKYRYR
uniref:Membrane protein FAM174B n=1 Tax=Geotrypetes seraphini TaxID=260995 RepID=A0A6P8PMI1_GEOSA|nr:membrane protein FAM174B [Geotrypetes seraphini]